MYSEHNNTILNRIERLRVQTGGTWAEVGQMLGISRTTLHLIRKGAEEPNERTLLLLEQAEINAGLRKPPGDKKGILRLLEVVPANRIQIEHSDHDARVVEVEVEFRRGSTPEGLTNKIPVKAPDASIAANLLVDLLTEEDYEGFVRNCLPPQYASKDFLNKLEPASFLRLLDAAVTMSLGANWRERVRAIAEESGMLKRPQSSEQS